MFTREKKLIALLLSAALALTMNTGIFAAAGAEDKASATAALATPTSSVQLTSATTSKLTDKKGQEFYITLSFNETPLYTGKKVDPAMLDATMTISYNKFKKTKSELVSGNITKLTVTKVKFQKGYKGKTVEEVKFYPSAVDVKGANLDKVNKKIVKAALKAVKPAKGTDPAFKFKVKKFSVSLDDVAAVASIGKKKADVKAAFTASTNYVLSVVPNKKNTKAAVKIWIKKYNKKGDLAPKAFTVKSPKKAPTFKYENSVFEFTDDKLFDTSIKLTIKDGKVSENAVSGNTVSANK